MRQLSRRSFLKWAALSLPFTSFLWHNKASAAETPTFLRQIVGADNSTERTVAWNTLHNIATHLELRDEEGTIRPYQPNVRLFTDDGESAYLQQVHLANLTPNTNYHYRLAGEVTTDWHTLRTLGADSAFRALIFPDSQCSDGYITWCDCRRVAQAQNPEASLCIQMGDLVDNGEAAYQWRQWFAGAEGLIENISFAPIFGNHETYDLQWKCRFPAAYLAYFPVPPNGSPRFAGQYYSFDQGPCHFMMLNTQMEEMAQTRPDLLQTELSWLKADASASHQLWKIVCMHKDVIEYDNPDPHDPVTGDISTTGRAFMPLFDSLGIDVVLTAHWHTYRRLGHIKNFQRDPAGPLYIDTGNCGNCYYDVPRNPRFDEVMLPQPERGNYMTLDAQEKELTFRCYLPDGREMDSVRLVKG